MTKKNNLVIYQSPSGAIELKGDFNHDTIWASLQQISDLFETDKSGISRHITNIYKTQELDKKATVAKIATVQSTVHSVPFTNYVLRIYKYV